MAAIRYAYRQEMDTIPGGRKQAVDERMRNFAAQNPGLLRADQATIRETVRSMNEDETRHGWDVAGGASQDESTMAFWERKEASRAERYRNVGIRDLSSEPMYQHFVQSSERTYQGSSQAAYVQVDRSLCEVDGNRKGQRAHYMSATRTIAVSPQTDERLRALVEERLFEPGDSALDRVNKLIAVAEDLMDIHHEVTHSFRRDSTPMSKSDPRRLSDEGRTHNATLTTFPQFLTEIGLGRSLQSLVLAAAPITEIYAKEVAADREIIAGLSDVTGIEQTRLLHFTVAQGGTEESIPWLAHAISAHRGIQPTQLQRLTLEHDLRDAIVQPMHQFNSASKQVGVRMAHDHEAASVWGASVGRTCTSRISTAVVRLEHQMQHRQSNAASPHVHTLA